MSIVLFRAALRSLVAVTVAITLGSLASTASAQTPAPGTLRAQETGLKVDYTVKVADIGGQL